MIPVSKDRLSVLEDRADLHTGARTLRAYDTPGHANHHVALHDPETGSRLYRRRRWRPSRRHEAYKTSNTAAGVFSREVAEEHRHAARTRATCVYLTHFGGYDDVAWHLDELLSRTWFWVGWVGGRLAAGDEASAAADALREMEDVTLARAGDTSLLRRYEEAGNYRMSVDGIARWWRKRGEQP